MAFDFSITGDTRLDTSGVEKGISSMTVAAGNLISDLVKTAGSKLAGLAQSSVSVGMGFDKAMSQVAATMGTTVDQIDGLTKVAKEMGSATKFSATEAAEALNYLALAGYDADKAAEVLPSVLNLAAAGGMELGRASDMVTDAMAALNIEATKNNVDDFGDKLAMASSKANASVSQLGDAILTVGGTAANLKGGTTELTTALGLLANVGVKGAEGGTALRNVILSLQSPTDTAAKTLQKLGVSVYDAQGNMRGLNEILGDLNTAMDGMTQGQKDSIISQLFNKTDLAAVNGLLAAQGEQWDTLAAQIDNADGAMAQMAETQIDNLDGAVTILQSAFEGLQLAVYDELEPTLTEVVKWGTECISTLSSALTEGGPEAMLQAAGEIISDLAAGISAKLPGLMSTGVQIITQLTQSLTRAMPAMLGTAGEVLGTLVQGIIDNLPELLVCAARIISELANYLGDHADDILDKGVQLVESVITGITAGLPMLITAAAGLIAKFAASLIAHLPDILKCGAAMLTTLVDGIIRSIENLAEAALACIAKLVGVWDGNMDEFGHIGENIVQGIINGIARMWNKLTSWVSGLISNLVGTASNAAVSGITESTADTPSRKGSTVTDDDRARRQKLHDERVAQAQSEAATAKQAAATVASSASAAAAAVDTAGKKASSSTKKNTASVVKSISDTNTTVKDGVTRTVETVNETLSNGKKQQKQVITETSRQMVDGVLKDVKTITEIAADGTKTVKQTMETVRETAKTVTSTFETLADGIKTTTQTVTETLTDGTEQQKQVITEVYDDVVDGALVTIERVKTIAADGTEQVAEQIKKSSADSLDGLWKEIQERANLGVLGTFDDLYDAVKNQDWAGVGLWVAKTIYGGLTANQKQQIEEFAFGMIDKLNAAMGQMQTDLAAKAWEIGTQICQGLTNGFGDVWQQASKLGSTLTSIFQNMKGPLSKAALAISQGLQGGLLSSFPSIYAGVAGMVGTIGAAFVGMLDAIAAALTSTIFGIPMAVVVAGAAVVLGAAIAAICSRLGGSKSSSSSGSSGTSGSGSSKTIASTTDITTSVAEDGTKTVVKTVTETLQDEAGKLTQKVTKTVTETGTKMVDGVERSCKTVTTYIDGIQQRIDTTLEDIAKDSTADVTPEPEPTPDPDPLPGTGSLEDAITANTKALEKTNSALADMIRQAGSLVLSDNMKLGSTVAASGTAQVAAAASSYHRDGDTNITQNIYSKAQSAADLQREARWEADRAKAQRR